LPVPVLACARLDHNQHGALPRKVDFLRIDPVQSLVDGLALDISHGIDPHRSSKSFDNIFIDQSSLCQF
jgi:hypothetical protein